MSNSHPLFSAFQSIPFNVFADETNKLSAELSGDGKINLNTAFECTKISIEQSTYWHVRYILSPLISPDTAAKEEWHKYYYLSKNLIMAIESKIPGSEQEFKDIEQLQIIKFIAQWNIEYYKSKPIQQYFLNIIGSIAVFFRNLGLYSIAIPLRDMQYFPKWTIRRNNDISYCLDKIESQ